MVSENAGRANFPTARENTSHIDDLKELLEEKIAGLARVLDERELRFNKTIDERDMRYATMFKAIEEKTSLALAGSEKAVGKAEMATEKRFDSVNEFRAQLKDQASTLMPREESTVKFAGLESKIEEIKSDITKLREYKSEATAVHTQTERYTDVDRNTSQFNITAIFSIIATLVSLLAIAMHYFPK